MMIQEAFAGDRKDFAPNASVLEAASLSPYLCSSTTIANVNKVTATATATSPASENNQLRCPRCDSSNTKFCYYNNYNLTQPRHFCKACRRYWTKGGALRNVPIGGGCRRNHKNTYIPTAPLGKPSSSTASGKFSSFNVTDHINGNKSPGFHSGYSQQEHLLPLSNISSWASPQRSQLLALLRSTQNPNPTLDSFKVKEGDKGFIFGSQMRFDQQRDEGSLGFDSLKNSSYWRNNNHNQQENGYMVQNRIISDHLYQRLGLESSANYCSDNLQAVDMNSNSSAILESASVTTSFSWFDLLARNGGYL